MGGMGGGVCTLNIFYFEGKSIFVLLGAAVWSDRHWILREAGFNVEIYTRLLASYLVNKCQHGVG